MPSADAASIVMGLVTAIYMLYRHYWSGGIVFLVFVGFLIFCFIVSRVYNLDLVCLLLMREFVVLDPTDPF